MSRSSSPKKKRLTKAGKGLPGGKRGLMNNDVAGGHLFL
jgi:hypothetical protein